MLLVSGIEPDEQLRIRAAGVARDRALVRADEQDVHRLVGDRPVDLLVGLRDLVALLLRGRGAAGLADVGHEAVGVTDGQTRRGEHDHHDGHAEQLEGEVAAEGQIGGDQSDGGDHDDRRPEHRPARHLVRGVDDIESGPGVADRLAAVEPVQERRGHGGHGDERPDPPAPRRGRGSGGATEPARTAGARRRRGLRHADVLVLSDLVDPVAAHAPPPRALTRCARPRPRMTETRASQARFVAPRRRGGRPRRVPAACPSGLRTRGRCGARCAPPSARRRRGRP